MTEEFSGEDSPSPSPATSPELTENDTLGFVFGYGSSKVNLRGLHPLPSQLQYYLKVFTNNVDPLHKVLHIPTTKALMREAENGLDSLTPSKEALLFAIYFAVIARSAVLNWPSSSDIVLTSTFVVLLLMMSSPILG